MLASLARWYEVSLLVVPLHGATGIPVPPSIESFCRRIRVVPPPGTLPLARVGNAARRLVGQRRSDDSDGPTTLAFEEMRFSAVHVFRLSALPFAAPYLENHARETWRLDLDEMESASRLRLADMLDAPGDSRARRMRLDASAIARIERDVLRAFPRIYVCSPRELTRVPEQQRAAVRVLPNALPDCPAVPAPTGRGPFTFLFVGSLAFPANADAVSYFCREVWPLVRAHAVRPCRLIVVGSGVSQALIDRTREAQVDFRGAVADVSDCYAEAHAVVVPLRFGGGTRLKVIEALRAGRPVIATTEAMEGIASEAGRDVLIGDGAAALAEHCLRLIREPRLTVALSTHARALYERDHRPSALADVLAADAPMRTSRVVRREGQA